MDKSWIQNTNRQTIRCFRAKQTLVATFIKNANSALPKHQKGIQNCWRNYFYELLNTVTVQHLEKFEEQIEEVYLTETEVSTLIKSLKAGKTFGEDDIRPKMLKVIKNFGVRWLTRMF